MTKAIDTFTSDGNLILTTSNKYSPNTVKGSYISQTDEIIPIQIIELGEIYLEITSIPIGLKITIEYNILGTLPSDNQVEYDLIERIVRLEQAIESLYEINKAQKEAINNRLNITAFRAWTKLIEKKTGIKLVEGDTSTISKELYK